MLDKLLGGAGGTLKDGLGGISSHFTNSGAGTSGKLGSNSTMQDMLSGKFGLMGLLMGSGNQENLPLDVIRDEEEEEEELPVLPVEQGIPAGAGPSPTSTAQAFNPTPNPQLAASTVQRMLRPSVSESQEEYFSRVLK